MNNNNTIGGYLGSDFQLKLFWQLLTDVHFSEKVIKHLSVDYFDDVNLKKLYLTILQYFEEYEQIPNLLNKSIFHAIKKYNTTNSVEEEILNEVLNKISYWHESVLNNQRRNDGEIIQKEIFIFIKQQEYRKLSEGILSKVRSGDIRNKKTIFEIEEKFQNINKIGDEEDYGLNLIEDYKKIFLKNFRKTIPTGILGIDELTGGGLGNGEIGLILAPTGTGKTTILTKIANSALEDGKNVLQIIFEDNVEEVGRKHSSIWSKIPLSEMEDRKEECDAIVGKYLKKFNNKLIIKKFDEDETTIIDVKNWILNHQKKFGYKFDLVILDYLDCLDSHKHTSDQNQAELVIVKALINMASKLDIPIWSAVQSNRSGINAELVDHTQMGGNIKRAQKTHFLMSIAKTPSQKTAGLANISILKARFASDGHVFKDCIFNNNTMEIRITGDLPNVKKLTDNRTLESLDEKLNKLTDSDLFNKDDIQDLLNK